jgi:catechol 2,3-dioxygenase
MTAHSPLWPAQVDHIRIDAADPAPLIAFYRDALGMTPAAMSDGTVLMQASQRRILLGSGAPRTQPFTAFRLQSNAQLARMWQHVERRGLSVLPNPTPIFSPDAFAVADPDGHCIVFGLPRTDLPPLPPTPEAHASRLAGRLQHVVVASPALPALLRFYEDDLGFTVSDYVMDGEQRTVGFFRSDPEHHSFAAFQCPERRPDHHSYEAGCWNDLRDWADHFASLGIKIWWGPGRHGPGNNLFLMIQDPQGYLVEISAEIEHVPDGVQKRTWPHEERTLNLWGPGFMRS